MPQPHWSDTVIAIATEEITRAKAAMVGALYRPVLRQPPVRQQVSAALAAPEQFPADARQRLLSMLTSKYGEQAQNVAAYIVGEPTPEEEGYDPEA